MKKVLVCIPLSWHMVHREFFFSYTDMMKHANDNGFDVQFITSARLYLHANRQALGDVVIVTETDYVLWIDADQTYPRNTISILSNHIDNGHLIVSGMTPDKMTGEHLCYTFNPDTKRFGGAKKTPLKPSQGLRQVECTGLGGVMIHPSVLKKIPQPHFTFNNNDTIYTDYGNIGEDFVFYWKCQQAGIDVWCDTNLHFGHMGTKITEINGGKDA